MNKKQQLREKIKKKIKLQKYSERRKKSSKIIKKLIFSEEFSMSRCIMLYVSKGTGEVETGPIIKKALKLGKTVFLPKTLVKERRILPVMYDGSLGKLKKGPYGIYEPVGAKYKRPVDKGKIDLIVVPGIAFDKSNSRLGHGKGYYDKFLSTLDKDIPKIGLCFRFQYLKRIPTTSKDVRLTKVLTN